MKKIYFILISILICTFIFISCKNDFSELNSEMVVSEITTSDDFSNDDDQGEDKGNGKKSPIIDQPKDDPEIKDYKYIDMEIKHIPFQIGAINTSMSSRQNHNTFTIVRSKEELNDITSGRYYQYWAGEGGPFNVFYLKDLTEKYDSDYFVNNALILYLFTSGSGGVEINVTDVQKHGSKLTIITDITWGMLTVITYSTVVLEVEKADIFGVTALFTDK